MSAFLIDATRTYQIAAALKARHERAFATVTTQDLACAMYTLNVESVCGRYGAQAREAFDVVPFEAPRSAGLPLSMVELCKALECWLYQSCEANCDESPLYKAIEAITGYLARNLVHELPAYDRAAWG